MIRKRNPLKLKYKEKRREPMIRKRNPLKRMKKTMRPLRAFMVSLAMLTSVSLMWAGAEDAFSQWKTEDWQKATEDGIPVLKSIPGQSSNVLYLNGKAEGDKLCFDVRLDNAFGTGDGNIGAAYKMPDGSQYFLEYNTVDEIIRIRRLGNDGSGNDVFPRKAYHLDVGSYHTMELEFAQNHLLWQIDGETVAEVTETGSDSFEDGTLYIQSYYADITLRNIRVESIHIPIYDFAFKTAEAVERFEATNSNVKWSAGRLVWSLTGADSSLISPPISAKQGTAYSMMLPLRNTILIRMSNGTDASRMKLSYTTTDDPVYSADKSMVLDIIPHSGDTTYYFNLSACPKLTGYLYGFKLEPIGATSGTIEIEEVTFEREAALSVQVGKLTACVTDGETVTITGTLESGFTGREVTLYETKPENYTLTLKDSEKLLSVTADGTSFTLTIPYMNDGLTRLSSLFLLSVTGDDGKQIRLGERFWIQNAEAYSGENPYAFTLPDYTVSVLDFGATGDGYTNDNAAIQAAIDHVYAKGGGVVVVPGDDSFYGRRYVATHITLKDNVELRIETGAVIWQSPRVEDYDYEVAVGHDVNIPGVNWAHAGSCHNYPLIHGDRAKNIRITGGGIIRMQDGGGENYDSVSGSIWTGCENKIHLVPLGFYLCENVEISNVHLRRTNNYHINFRNCRRIYCSGVSMWEVTCASGDGISATVGTKDIIINQCFLYTNDDAVTICSTYNDPRGLAWWHANPEGDNCVDNLVVRHSYLVGGHGITFITWGTDNPQLDKQEIKNVEVFDCVLGGSISAVGSWADNPYFGKKPYDGSEVNDYSPVKGVRIHNNRYVCKATLDSIQGTDVITDCGIRSATQFQYGNFERRLRQYPTYESGLSNWTFLPVTGKDGRVAAETEAKNHYGALYGEGMLCQGLWMSKGEHTFTADVRLLAGKATLTVRDALTGEVIAEKAVSASNEFKTVTLSFTLSKGRTAYLGVTHTGSAGQAVHMDNASVTSEEFKGSTYFTEFTEGFEDAECQLINTGFTVAGGIALAGAGMTGVMMLQTEESYEEFDLHYRMRYDAVNSDNDANIGVSLRRSDGNNQYDIHYNPLLHVLNVNEYVNGQPRNLFQKLDFDLEPGQWIDMAFRVQDDTCIWFMNGEEIAKFPMDSVHTGIIALVAFNVSCAYDDVVVAKAGTTVIVGDEQIPTDTETDTETEPTVTEPVTETNPQTEQNTDTPTDPATSGTAEQDPTVSVTDTGENASQTTPQKTDRGCHSSLWQTLPVLAMLMMAGISMLFLWRRRENG